MDDVMLGDRELDVMGVLWELRSGTVAEVRERLPAELAYTTVLTILRNLEEKGFVSHEVEGRAHFLVQIPLDAPAMEQVTPQAGHPRSWGHAVLPFGFRLRARA